MVGIPLRSLCSASPFATRNGAGGWTFHPMKHPRAWECGLVFAYCVIRDVVEVDVFA